MRTAWLLRGPGEYDAFERVQTEIPAADADRIVVKVRAFGLNRSELFSRRGMSSPDFSFPRVLGLECVGEVLDPWRLGSSDGRARDGDDGRHGAQLRRRLRDPRRRSSHPGVPGEAGDPLGPPGRDRGDLQHRVGHDAEGHHPPE